MKKIIIAICAVLVLMFIVPICINWIVTNDFSILFINEGNHTAYIGYYSAITGGGLTLSGVAWTIRNQRKEKKSDVAVQYMPIIIFKSSSVEKDKNVEFSYDYSKNGKFEFEMFLYNLGRGECTDYIISIYQINGDDSHIKISSDTKSVYNGIIVANGIYQTTHEMIVLNFENLDSNKMIYPIFKIRCKYMDLYENLYESTATIETKLYSVSNGIIKMSVSEIKEMRFRKV